MTVFNYDKTAKKHVIPVFGNYKLKDITTPQITEFYKTLVQLTSERPALKTITVKKIHTILSSVFSLCCNYTAYICIAITVGGTILVKKKVKR